MDNVSVVACSNVSYTFLYENLAQYFLKWYLPVVLTFGFLGSVVCFVAILRSKMFAVNMRFWLICICVGDLFILLLEGIWMFLKVWFRYDFRDENDTVCIVHTWLSNYLFYWSAYVQSLVSIQRCYIVLRPLSAQAKHLSLKHLTICLTLVTLILVIPTVPYPLFWRVLNGDCDPTDPKIFRLTTILDLVFWGLIPVILMTTCTAIIWHNLIERHRQFGPGGQFKAMSIRRSVNRESSSDRILECNTSNRSNTNNISSNNTSKHRKTMSRVSSLPLMEMQFAKFPKSRSAYTISSTRMPRQKRLESRHHVTFLLIGMNIFYMTSVFPLIVYFICLNFIVYSINADIHRFIYYMLRSFCFLNACTNWIFYCVAGNKVRRQTTRFFSQMCCPQLVQHDKPEHNFAFNSITYRSTHLSNSSCIAHTNHSACKNLTS